MGAKKAKAEKKARKAAKLAAETPVLVDWSTFDPEIDLAPAEDTPTPDAAATHRISGTPRKLSLTETERLRALSSIGGYRAAAKLTPAERSARASKAGKASALKRAADRAARGEVVRSGTRYGERPQPSPRDLAPWFEEFDKQNPDLEVSYEERRRGALLLMRQYIASLALRDIE